jgi:hypothetical protein
VPAYLQHADVVIVPHVITPFTESLDPIKAYECQAIGTPTVATPVAGFRDIKGITVSEAPGFVPAIREVLAAPRIAEVGLLPIRSWAVATLEFEHVLQGVAESGDSPADPLRSHRPGARWPRGKRR